MPVSLILDHDIEPPYWVEDMPEGVWFRISGNEPDLGLMPTPPGTRYLEETDPARDSSINPPFSVREKLRRMLGRKSLSPWHGRVGFSAITEAWNSAVFAHRYGDCGSMIIFGGGHANYYGSDVHAFDLATRQWSRVTDGYTGGGVHSYGEGAVYPSATYPDGSPLPPHTYDYLQYDPAGNDVLLLKGQTELGEHVKAIAIPHLFNLDNLRWRHGPRHQDAILNSAGFTTWDPIRRILWGHSGDDGGGNSFLGYNPDGENKDGTFGSWSERYDNKFQGEANHNCMQMDCAGNVILVVNHDRNALFAINPQNPEHRPVELRESGEKPQLSAYAALEYSTVLQCFVYYSANGGPDIYAITAPLREQWAELLGDSWVWSRLNAGHHELDPISEAAAQSHYAVNRSHTFGRFRVADYRGSIALAILVRHVDTPVYVAKLTEATS